MSEPIWSRHLARGIADVLGFPMQETTPDGRDESLRREGERLVEEITETFRYLPAEPINWARDLAHFLRAELDGRGGPAPYGWPVEKLREVRDYVLFLRGRHGHEHSADEKDYWTDEDREDLRHEALRRLDEQDPYPWKDTDVTLPG
jgi:hypothetical protein